MSRNSPKITTRFSDATPEAGRTFVAVWTEDDWEGPDGEPSKEVQWGYGALYSLANEPFGMKLFRGNCRSDEEARREESHRIKDGRWIYLSDLIRELENPHFTIQVEGGIDETSPYFPEPK